MVRVARAERLRRHDHDHVRTRWASRDHPYRGCCLSRLYVVALLLGVIGLPLVLAGPELVADLIPDSLSVLNALYWPVVILVSVAFLTTLYHLSVPVRTAWLADLPGAAIALLIWILGGIALRTILGAAIGGSSLYGPLTAPIAVLLWLYVTALAVLIGAALNAEIDKRVPGTGDLAGSPGSGGARAEGSAGRARRGECAIGRAGRRRVVDVERWRRRRDRRRRRRRQLGGSSGARRLTSKRDCESRARQPDGRREAPWSTTAPAASSPFPPPPARRPRSIGSPSLPHTLLTSLGWDAALDAAWASRDRTDHDPGPGHPGRPVGLRPARRRRSGPRDGVGDGARRTCR